MAEANKVKKGSKMMLGKESLNVGDYLLDVAELEYEKLVLDTTRTHGQIRSIDEGHVQQLARAMLDNPPIKLTVTTWASQGKLRNA